MLQKLIVVTCLVTLLISASLSHGSSENVEKITETPLIRNGLVGGGQRVVSVDDFGAKGDGVTDDSEAFIAAWKNACSSRRSVLLVPSRGTYLLKQITFSGPCKPEFTLRIEGNILASSNMEDYERDIIHWLIFNQVTDFTVNGGGTINGNGEIWWQNSCRNKKTQPCKTETPMALQFQSCTHLKVDNLRIKDAQRMHLSFFECKSVNASRINITSPEWSPNTDGIHVNATQDIKITHANIATGDDCISIVNGSRNVRAMDILCGPGHGISIGSLGKNHTESRVSDVHINGATLIGTSNGVRIKTWQGGRGYAHDIVFENILMRNVSNPIIIDQNYCDQQGRPCTQQVGKAVKKEAVEVKHVLFKNISGTSASEVAMTLECSEVIPCANITAQDVQLYLQEEEDGGVAKAKAKAKAKATCANVRYLAVGNVFPRC